MAATDTGAVVEESSGDVPDHAHTVLVPLANPETAPGLLHIARSLVTSEGGRVLALSVAVGDADAEKSVAGMDELEARVSELDPDIEFLRRSATTIARGILDAARESGADMIVLGLNHVSRGRVEFGKVVESVVAAATCDVLLFRPGRAIDDLSAIDRVVVGVDASPVSRAAARVGILLGDGFDRPVHVLTVHDGGQPRSVAHGVLDEALRDVRDSERCRRQVVKATSAAAGLTSSADRDDLLVVGFEDRTGFREWIEGEVARRVLDRASGPTIAVSRLQPSTPVARGVQRVVQWLRPTLTSVEAETIVWRSQALATTSLDYMTLIVVSAVLASLGLLLDSAAVIIGAMLVAPLMGPLVAFAIALRVARMQVVARALFAVVIGTASAFAVSVVIGLVVPLALPTSEMLSRGQPSLLDAGVAIASGIVGAYATARKDIPSALAGVAIAAALVPPICVSGLALGLGEADLAGGAALLFTVNIVCIAVIGTVVFAWLGLEPNEEASPGQRHISVLAGLLLSALIGVLLAVSAARLAISDQDVQDALDVAIPTASLDALEVVENDPRRLRISIRDEEAPRQAQVDALLARLQSDLDEPDLQVEVVFLPTLRAGVPGG